MCDMILTFCIVYFFATKMEVRCLISWYTHKKLHLHKSIKNVLKYIDNFKRFKKNESQKSFEYPQKKRATHSCHTLSVIIIPFHHNRCSLSSFISSCMNHPILGIITPCESISKPTKPETNSKGFTTSFFPLLSITL